MRKYVNYRPVVVVAVAMVLATILATYVFVSTKSKLISFCVLMFLFILSVVIIYRLKKRALYLLSAAIFMMAVPFGLIYLKSVKVANFSKSNGKEFVITGKISEKYKFSSSGNLVLSLTDINVLEGDVSKIPGTVTLYSNPNNLNLEDFAVGRIIKVKTNLTFFNLQDDVSRSVSFLSRNNTCYGYVNFYNFELTDEYKISVRDEFCTNIYKKLQNFGVLHSDVGYAMLFGESNYLDDDVKSEFRETGIAHIVAVSGLHFSVIFGIILFVIRIFKLPVNYFIGIKILIIFIYCYLCKFSVSVVRAGLLSFILIYTLTRGRPYDNMSSLALVVMLLLLNNPLVLFNLSFILSFSAVISIALLTHPFEKLFSKVFREKFASALAVNFSVQIGLFAINMIYFGKFSCLGILANLILVPIVSFSFVLLFIGVLFSDPFPISLVLAKIYGYLMDVVVKFNRYISKINFSLRLGNIHTLAILFTFIMMLVVSDYLFISKKQRLVAGLVSIGLLLLCMFI